MLNRRLILLCILILSVSSAWCDVTDSLSQRLYVATTALDSAHVLKEFARYYYRDSAEVQLKYAMQAHELYQKSLNKDDSLLLEIHYLKGASYEVLGNHNLAIESLQSSLEIGLQHDWKPGLTQIYNYLGTVYDDIGAIEDAVNYYHKSSEIAVEISDTVTYIATQNNIGILYLRIDEYSKAESIFLENLDLGKKIKDYDGLSITQTNLGIIAYEKESIDEAISYFEKALHLSDSLGIADLYSLLYLGDIYMDKEQHNVAYRYYYNSYNRSKQLKMMEFIPDAALSLSDWHFKREEYRQSLKYDIEALEVAKYIDSRESLIYVNESLSENYEVIADFEKALYYYKEYKQEQDSFLDQEKVETFAELDLRFASKKKEAENLFLIKEQEKNNTIIEQQRVIFIIGSILFMALAFGLRALWLKNKREQGYNVLLESQVQERTSNLIESNQQLVAANQELERFAYITSHDLKEPLRNIAGFSSLLSRKIKNGQYSELPEYLQYINNSTHQMNNLVDDILIYSKIGYSEDSANVSLATLIQQAKSDLHHTIAKSNAQVTLSVDKSHGDATNIYLPYQLSLIFKNLIENGIKYNESESPTMEISYDMLDDDQVITFRDNGFGIEKQYQDLVFEMFKRLHNRSKYQGSGIGLSICKKVAKSLGGTINILSSSKEGTTIEFTIPVKKYSGALKRLAMVN